MRSSSCRRLISPRAQIDDCHPEARVEIQSVYKEIDAQGRIGLYTYVVAE
jgi:hypothetical protein